MSQENSTGSREVMKGLMGVAGGLWGSATTHTLDAAGEAPLCCPRGGSARGCSDSLYVGPLESPV